MGILKLNFSKSADKDPMIFGIPANQIRAVIPVDENQSKILMMTNYSVSKDDEEGTDQVFVAMKFRDLWHRVDPASPGSIDLVKISQSEPFVGAGYKRG